MVSIYPYHARIKQRIRNGELIGYEFVDDYPKIGECLVLKFNTYPPFRPIRPHKYVEYVDILADWNHGQYPRLDTAIEIANHLNVNHAKLIPKKNIEN